MDQSDPYAVLGVDPTASDQQIKQALRAHAKRLHSDRGAIAPEQQDEFKRITNAYAMLKTPAKRAAVDAQRQRLRDAERQRQKQEEQARREARDAAAQQRRRRDGVADSEDGTRQQPETPPSPSIHFSYERYSRPGPGSTGSVSFQADLSPEQLARFLDDLLNASRRSAGQEPPPTPKPVPGQNREGTVLVTPGQAAAGVTIPLSWTRRVTCPMCFGQGTTALTQDACGTCNGEGLVPQAEHRESTFPPGMHDGARLKITGGGDDGFAGGKPGDLIVTVDVIRAQRSAPASSAVHSASSPPPRRKRHTRAIRAALGWFILALVAVVAVVSVGEWGIPWVQRTVTRDANHGMTPDDALEMSETEAANALAAQARGDFSRIPVEWLPGLGVLCVGQTEADLTGPGGGYGFPDGEREDYAAGITNAQVMAYHRGMRGRFPGARLYEDASERQTCPGQQWVTLAAASPQATRDDAKRWCSENRVPESVCIVFGPSDDG